MSRQALTTIHHASVSSFCSTVHTVDWLCPCVVPSQRCIESRRVLVLSHCWLLPCVITMIDSGSVSCHWSGPVSCQWNHWVSCHCTGLVLCYVMPLHGLAEAVCLQAISTNHFAMCHAALFTLLEVGHVLVPAVCCAVATIYSCSTVCFVKPSQPFTPPVWARLSHCWLCLFVVLLQWLIPAVYHQELVQIHCIAIKLHWSPWAEDAGMNLNDMAPTGDPAPTLAYDVPVPFWYPNGTIPLYC
jgi:hypothetical protein